MVESELKMSSLNHGWWICFLSVVEEVQAAGPVLETVLESVAKEAGVTQHEINEAFAAFPGMSAGQASCLARLQAKLRRYR